MLTIRLIFSVCKILNFKDNQIYDLSNPETSDQLQIVDIMKTMDNRIAIDSDTLKQFVADPYIKATADRFRAQKEKINQRRNAASYGQTCPACVTSFSRIHCCQK